MGGARYHVVFTRVWSNPEFRARSADARDAWMYLLTCPHRNTEGLFRLPIPAAAYDLQWSPERTATALAELEAAGFIAMDPATDVVWLINAIAANTPKGPKQVKGAVNALAEVPSSPALQARYLDKCREVCPELAEAIGTHLKWDRYPIDTPSEGLGYPSDCSFSFSLSNSSSASTSATVSGDSTPAPAEVAAAADEVPLDLPTELLRLAGYPTIQPSAGERSTVEGCLARGLTPADLRAIAARASIADVNPRGLLLKLLTEALNDPASFRASPARSTTGRDTRSAAEIAAATYRPYEPPPDTPTTGTPVDPYEHLFGPGRPAIPA